jgi:hypothetical protein
MSTPTTLRNANAFLYCPPPPHVFASELNEIWRVLQSYVSCLELDFSRPD